MSISLSLLYVLPLVFLQHCVEALEVDSMSYAPELAISFPRLVKLDTAPLSLPPPPTGTTAPPPKTPPPPPPPPKWSPSSLWWPPYLLSSSPPPLGKTPPSPIYPSYYSYPRSSYNSTVIVALPIIAVIMIFICSLIWSHHQRVIADQSRVGRDFGTSGDTVVQQAALQMQGRQGLDHALVNTLPTLQFTAQKSRVPKTGRKEYLYSCAVCISDFEEGEMLKLLPACGHAFHKECIDMWLFSHRTCPLCRLSLLNNKGDLILLEMDEEEDASDSRCGVRVAVDVEDSASRPLDQQVVSPLIKMFRRTQSSTDSPQADMAGTRGLRRSCSQPMGNSKIHPSHSAL